MQISQKKPTLQDCVFAEMRNFKPWTFWDLQQAIKNDFGVFYGEPTISAAIRELRKTHARLKYNFPKSGEVVIKDRRINRKGYTYRLCPKILKHWNSDEPASNHKEQWKKEYGVGS